MEEEGELVEFEVADEGTRWVGGGTASPLIVTTDPPAPRSSVGAPPFKLTKLNHKKIISSQVSQPNFMDFRVGWTISNL